jgi:hypothetical protein
VPPPRERRGVLQQQALRCTELYCTCQQALREVERVGMEVSELLGSNLGQDTDYPYRFFVVYPSPSKTRRASFRSLPFGGM